MASCTERAKLKYIFSKTLADIFHFLWREKSNKLPNFEIGFWVWQFLLSVFQIWPNKFIDRSLCSRLNCKWHNILTVTCSLPSGFVVVMVLAKYNMLQNFLKYFFHYYHGDSFFIHRFFLDFMWPSFYVSLILFVRRTFDFLWVYFFFFSILTKRLFASLWFYNTYFSLWDKFCHQQALLSQCAWDWLEVNRTNIIIVF